MFVKFFIAICLILVPIFSSAQGVVSNEQYESLKKEHAALKTKEDSMARSLAASRKQFEQGTADQRKVAAEAIVRLESEVFDVRGSMSKVANRISAVEQQFAEQSLSSGDAQQVEKRGFFNNDIFTRNLKTQDRARLSSSARIESEVIERGATVASLYGRLLATKEAYDKTTSQRELDSLRVVGEKINAEIANLDRLSKAAWGAFFDFKVDTYAALLDRIGNLDRMVRENVESYGREVRRAEALAEGSLAPQSSIFAAQRALIHTYEKSIATSKNLRLASDSIARVKPLVAAREAYLSVDFAPRVLTLYAPVTFIKGSLPVERVDQIENAIIPERGVYYSVQIALMSSPPKSLDMFKGAWPLQVDKMADGKYRYMVGGFNTYAQALVAVGQLQKAGYKAPVMVAWIDGKPATSAKAKAYQATVPAQEVVAGSFKLEVRSSDSAVGETLRSLVEMHAKGKVIARSGAGKDMLYTVAEFADKYEAQTLAQIVGDRTGAKVEVVEIKLN